ncbi:MAG: T9SS type A sorting domain-containing protein [Calditrichaeota bacterium]|nr:T9SS type A sorting domain-containing protein [Calditrichota bacterium]
MGREATKFSVAAIWSLLLATVAQAGHLVIVWEPNREPDVAGYIVHYGTRPGTYQASIDVGPKTRVLVGPLADSVRYYFAVSAYDRWNNESALSREVSGVVGQGEILPTEFVLHPSFPNPFTTDTWLVFDLPSADQVEFRIFDINGKLVRTLRPPASNAGANAPVLWDGFDDSGRPVPSGIYYCRGFGSTARSQTIRLIRVR